MDKFNLTQAAARKYDDHSVPAMFGPLARATMSKVSMPEGAHVIDIACGTGALTREIATHLRGNGHLVGTDLNDTMIELAAQRHPKSAHNATYFAADVCNLPIEDANFDFAFCQQGLQFFPDKPSAVAEIRRVLKTGGQLALTCWSAISPFNKSLSDALAHHVGDAASVKAKAPFSYRDGNVIEELLESAGFSVQSRDTIVLERRFDDLFAQIMALPIEKDLSDAGEVVTHAVVKEVAAALEQYAKGGAFVVPQESHLFEAHV